MINRAAGSWRDVSSGPGEHLRVRDEPLSSGTNPYAEHSRLVPDVPFYHGKDTNLPRVEFTTPAYMIRRCERPFYMWTDADFSEPSEECSLVC